MPTTNPVPSQDPSDLLFNAGKLDEVLNGTGNSFTDRLGTARRTVAGMNADFDAQLADAESDLNVYRADAAASAAEALGYLQTIRATSYGAYASDPATDPLGNPPTVGDEYFNTTANLLKRWNGTTWQASDINTANLAAPSGSSLVGYDAGTVQDVLDTLTGPTGAASIGYTPAGTGAVATTLQEKARERVSILDFMNVFERQDFLERTAVLDAAPVINKAMDEHPNGADIDVPAGAIRINSQVVVKSNIRLFFDHSTKVVHGANTKLFRMKPRSAFIGGQIDTRNTALATFSSTVFEFDGTDAIPYFRGVAPTTVKTELLGNRGIGSGTAIHMHATGAESNIYGAEIDIGIDGYENGVLFEKDGDATRWINGNRMFIRGVATSYLIKQVTSQDGQNVDANFIKIDYQTTVDTVTVLTIAGRYNQIDGMIWDFPQSGTAVLCTAGSSRNKIVIGGVVDARLSDLGSANIIELIGAVNPGLKLARIMQNSSATLRIEGNDVLLSNAKALQWLDSAGVSKSILTLSGSNNTTINSPGNMLIDAVTRHSMYIGGAEKIRIDGDTTAGNTSMLLWDVSKGTLSRVSVGVNDSGGAGFKVLRVPN